MTKVIEWTTSDAEELIWKYPDDRIEIDSELIVMENQLAIIYMDGTALDTLSVGRHKLNKKTLPMMAEVVRKIQGGIIPVSCIFISRSQFKGLFGGRTQTSDLAPLMFHGVYWFRIKEPRVFVSDVVGNQRVFNTRKVNDYMRSFINERIIDEMSHYDLQTVFTRLDETSLKTKTNIRMSFERVGVELIDLKFNGIDTPEKYRDRMFWLKTGNVRGEDIVRMETISDVAGSISQKENICSRCGTTVGAQQFCHVCGERVT